MNAITEYNNLIQSGKINACRKLKAVYSHLVKQMRDTSSGYVYDQERADRAIGFIEHFIHIPKMRGSPLFKLELWQKALISAIFGFVDKHGYRKYQECFLFVGRKNSKSVLGAAIALYMLLADGEDGPEVYSAATDRKQARIVWEYAKIMVAHDPNLKKYIKMKFNSLECKTNFGKFVPLSKNSGSMDGLNISCLLIDELHAIKDRNIYDVLKGGTYARKQPLTIIMSTGGYSEQDSIFDVKYEEYRNIIEGYTTGKYTDETTLPIIYELDDKNEIADEANWIKANPNLGISKSLKQLRTEFNKATLNERTMRDLLVKQFNFREAAKEAFLICRM